VRLLKGERDSLRDSQVRALLKFLLVTILGMTAWLVLSGRYGVEDAVRLAAFNVVSVVTTTGYATSDYGLWGNAAVGVFFALAFIGGCTGSTSGGIKIFRFEVMTKVLRSYLRHLIYPRGVFQRVYAGRLLPDDVVASVVVFFAFFISCYSGFTILLMALDLDFLTSASAAASALANVGPGLGPIIGPAGNFSTLPDAAKWLLAFGMLLGRLELFTVLVLLLPQFWRGIGPRLSELTRAEIAWQLVLWSVQSSPPKRSRLREESSRPTRSLVSRYADCSADRRLESLTGLFDGDAHVRIVSTRGGAYPGARQEACCPVRP
jgi:trk system potassium uptake protein TrkH